MSAVRNMIHLPFAVSPRLLSLMTESDDVTMAIRETQAGYKILCEELRENGKHLAESLEFWKHDSKRRAIDVRDLLAALEDAEFLMRKAGQFPGPMQDSFKRSAEDARAAIARAKGKE